MKLWAIGHSSSPADTFIALLGAHNIRTVVDVRRFPASRRYPHFDRAALERALAAAGIGYLHVAELGGRREPRPDSPNTGWREAGFRGYADYMETPGCLMALERLIAIAGGARTAMMCAEADWRNCHRGLIADALKLRGIEVLHIRDARDPEPHAFTGPAQVVDGRLSYALRPPRQHSLDL
ncbi:MAG: DUF488 domain-containing protein [Burkholderiales bacterium]